MRTLTVRIDEKSRNGRVFMDLLEILSEDGNGIEIIAADEKTVQESQNFSREVIAYYQKFHKAGEEANAIERGELEGISLNKTLDEI